MDALIIVIFLACLPFALFTAFWVLALVYIALIHIICAPFVLCGVIKPENMRS